MGGVAANCNWGHTVSDPKTQPCSLRLVLRLRLSKPATLEAHGTRCMDARTGMQQTQSEACLRYSLDPKPHVRAKYHDLFV